uniref:Protein kinase domain-containing protein n=1 Tax=Dendroctonus ponderosae TaxID=77166 RepID=A0AAR5P7Q3_DENPD
MTLQDTKSKKLYIIGNYRFSEKLLGKGNFARVEEAMHTILNVKVAVKIMDVNQIKEDYVIRNLCREAKIMAKLNHPCVCALYQTMQRSDNVYYLVTELASGGDLCSFVKEQRGGRLEERPTRIYARQFVSALAHMHQLGVVHRDLKMENVMLNSAQTQIKIVDFGLSNFYSPEEPLKTHCGSPEYAAPELFITGMKYGSEVDLWSLGIILYGMVVGHLPFVSNRNEQLSSQDRRKRLVSQISKGLRSSHRKDLSIFSPDFRNMISRMLIPDVTKRISIKDVMVHPFVTEKGGKLIRTSPMKKLDFKHQAGIIADICDLVHLSTDEVIRKVKEEPFSRIGGMYNILTRAMALSHLSGDGISKLQPVPEINTSLQSPQNSPVKRPYNLRSIASKPLSGRDTPTITVQDRKVSLRSNKKPPMSAQGPFKIQAEFKRPGTPTTAMRPRTVQLNLLEKKNNYKDIKTAFLARKTNAAGLTPKSFRPSTVSSPIAVKVSSSLNTRASKEVVRRLYPGPDEQIEPNREAKNVKPTNSLNPRAQSEKLPNNRPTTTNGGFIRRSLAVTQSDPKATTNRPQTTSKEYKPLTRLLKMARPATSGQPREKPTMAYGDIAQRNQTIYQKSKKPTIYDPIARSIAGSVCNNVPNKLPTLGNFKM